MRGLEPFVFDFYPDPHINPSFIFRILFPEELAGSNIYQRSEHLVSGRKPCKRPILAALPSADLFAW
jgi:hypothetical protein